MNQRKIFTTSRLTRDAMLSAVCAVLGYVALDLGNIKITFESFPVLTAGFLFGPIDGLIVGGMGTLIYQLLRYGISVTTALWMLPYLLCGLFTGLAARGVCRGCDRRRVFFTVVLMEFMITAINTGVIFIDSKIYGYYSFVYVFGLLPLRIFICLVKSTAFGILMPYLLNGLNRAAFINRHER